jgi:hypothetical protein
MGQEHTRRSYWLWLEILEIGVNPRFEATSYSMSHGHESGRSGESGGMKAYSLDLRTRVVEAMDRRVGTQPEVATLLGVSCTFLKTLLRQRRERGNLAPTRTAGAKSLSWRRHRGRRWGAIFYGRKMMPR